ncbi:hypothetical protein HNQ71_004071 [Mesorhizobium sangaii]|uniref:Uncharacterized protein n=1 Tax=Mesorhizobium sangaii TaxID=505389 RepID=A0A841P869_9HYPH|nr:hypothetical protein [Mesorhizobium sangaii]
MSVDILTPQQFEAATRPPPAPVTPALPKAPAAVPPPTSSPPRPQPPATAAMIRPTEMLSAKTLADPRSRQARADLATFASDERMVQLCNLEAGSDSQMAHGFQAGAGRALRNGGGKNHWNHHRREWRGWLGTAKASSALNSWLAIWSPRKNGTSLACRRCIDRNPAGFTRQPAGRDTAAVVW